MSRRAEGDALRRDAGVRPLAVVSGDEPRYVYEPIGRLHQINQLYQAGRASSEPSARLVSAAASLTMASAVMSGRGMRASPMRKLLRERSVCAPQ